MEWELRLGSHRRTLETNAAHGDAQAAKGLDAAPELDELAMLYHSAWSALSTSRSAGGFSVGGIPYPVITAWGRDHGIEDLDDLERLVWGVQAIDTAFLEWVSKRKPKD